MLTRLRKKTFPFFFNYENSCIYNSSMQRVLEMLLEVRCALSLHAEGVTTVSCPSGPGVPHAAGREGTGMGPCLTGSGSSCRHRVFCYL